MYFKGESLLIKINSYVSPDFSLVIENIDLTVAKKIIPAAKKI
jgi:hypothetical protein|tara:strand:+ start:283 stop:411 length:129 start_codon:yes stop_codon:yes gene_type:complete